MNDSLPPLSAENEILIDMFADAMWLESGLSKNTLSAYRSDLSKFAQFLEQSSLLVASQVEVQKYLAHCMAAGLKGSSSARILSTMSPKLGRPLPKSLSEDEVDALLGSPDLSKPIGMRDQAMLETLYATGLRVSELVELKMVELNLSVGVVRIIGKGNKERLVPLGEESSQSLQNYLSQAICHGKLFGT